MYNEKRQRLEGDERFRHCSSVISHFNSRVRAEEKILAFYDHNSFYQVSLGTLIPPEPWDLLSFLIYSMRMLKYRETQRAPVVSTAPWNEATRVFTKIPTTEQRMELVLPHVREPAPAEVDLWVCL